MKVSYVLLALCVIVLYASCLRQRRAEPLYPKDVSGWKGRKGRGSSISRSFVLRKGEATDNGKVEVRVVDIIPGDPYAGAGSFQLQARARIQFIRMFDSKVICEDTYAETSGSGFVPESCGSSMEDISFLEHLNISGVVILAINLKEEWVFFSLNG